MSNKNDEKIFYLENLTFCKNTVNLLGYIFDIIKVAIQRLKAKNKEL